MTITVLHSQDRTDPLVEMDEADLVAFRIVSETDLYTQTTFGYRCRCHDWIVQQSGRVDYKVGIESLLAAGELK